MSKAKTVSIRAQKDSSDTYGVRGAGQTWQAVFGMAIARALKGSVKT